jgi:hypothetical protein
MKNYLLTIRVPFEAMDDLEARQKTKIENKIISLNEADIKIQEVFKDQPPRKVSL